MNRAWSTLVGIEPDTVVGRTIRQVMPGVEEEWIDDTATVVDKQRSVSFTRQVGALSRWYDGVLQPLDGNRFALVFSEVTTRAEGERHLAELDERRRLATEVGEAASGIWPSAR